MSKKIRNTDPSKIHLITIRTENAALFLRPGKGLENLLGGIVAKYQEETGLEIFAYNFLGNHYHILCRAPKAAVWEFAEDVNREIAKRVNFFIRRHGHFWSRPYDDQIVVEVPDATEAFLYITTNAVHHGLVSHPSQWPGLNSYWQSLSEEPKRYFFTHYTEYSKALRKARRTKEVVRIEDHQTSHLLTLTPLPQFEELTTRQRSNKLRILIDGRAQNLKDERLKAGKRFMGREKILAQSPFQIPANVKRSPRPLCYTKSFDAKQIFMDEYFPKLADYIDASKRFRGGDLYTEFPPYTIKPPLLHLL